jgi:hypothetical protein
LYKSTARAVFYNFKGGIERRGYGEPQAHGHPRRVILHRHINCFTNIGKVDDLVDLGIDFLFREPEHRAIDVNILIGAFPSALAPFGPTFGCSSYGLPSPSVPDLSKSG